MSESFMTPQGKRLISFMERRQEMAACVWQDPLMQDLIAHLAMERGLQQMGSEISPFSLENVLAYVGLAYVAGQVRMEKAEALQKMLGVDASTLEQIVCPGCGYRCSREAVEQAAGACPECGYENNSSGADRLLTIGEILEDWGDYNDVRLGEFLRSLRSLGMLVVPEAE